MIRNLKALLAAALALTAFGALAASAQAADEFHCSVEPCRLTLKTDGTAATAHQVIIFENLTTTESASFTCESLRGEAEVATRTSTEIRLAWPYTVSKPNNDREALDNCKINGSAGVIWHMRSCEYRFTAGATGNAGAGRTDEAEVHVICETAGDKIEYTIPNSTCVFTIGPQTLGGGGTGVNGFPKGGIGYHTSGVAPNREITVTMNLHEIVVTKDGDCSAFFPGNPATLIGTYTTGNFLLTGETTAGVMGEAWFE